MTSTPTTVELADQDQRPDDDPNDTRSTTSDAAVTIAVALAVGCGGLWIVTHLGWVGDVVAIASPLAVMVGWAVVVACVLLRRRRLAGVVCAIVVAGAVGIALPRIPHPTGAPVDPVTISAVNLQFDSTTPDATVRSALASTPDVLVVSELTPRTDQLLRGAFPYRIVTDRLERDRYGQGVYSTIPVDRLELTTALAGTGLRVRVRSSSPFVLYAVHLPRASLVHPDGVNITTFAGNRSAAMTLDRLADAESEPVVIAGDLNLSDRTSGYRALAHDRHDALRGGWVGRTYVGSGLLWAIASLRIDHLFIPGDWCHRGGHRFTLRGSDHRGVQARIGPCA